uniref:Uncharacterized protein n=1 Tax=Tanacetum cinerariifolium TaxID=118510 RepID=A0A6L2LQQ0_TANCI|nr:hypothetical protein [Tanacetum cinerariifolium]
MKAARYLDFVLELHKFYIDRHITKSSRKVVRTHMRILNVVSIKAFSCYGYDYLKEITLRRADYQEYMIAEKDFKNLYPSDFEDLNLLLLQDFQLSIESYQKQLNLTKLGWDAKGFDDGTLTYIMEALDYRVKEYNVSQLNPDQEWYEHVGPQDTRSQDGERPQVDDQRLDLADDLKEAQDHISRTITSHKTKITTSMILYCMICKREDHRTLDHELYTASLKRSENYKAQPYQYASSSKQILRGKANPFPPCTHYGFNDHTPDNCKNYHECEICRSYDHFTLKHNHVIHIRERMLAESSQSSESSIGVKYNTYRSTVHFTTDHNEFDHFKTGEKIQATKAREPTKKWVYKINEPVFIIYVETHQEANLVPGQWMLKEYDWCQE